MIKNFVALSALFFLLTGSAYTDSDSQGIVKYVQGGSCNPGDGSKKHPYNSLALAQADTSWTTLVVLASPVALDGGITMRAGTKLIGEKNPVDGPVSANQPTITNSSSALNGGNGWLVCRNRSINRIFLADQFGS